ncbi:molybdenum cofactor guanylyltransferase [Cytobacillus sp. S13-E01]|uniref:molybdenum cofactor guanylyltransferase n=1 Tax=Cytobacillus sp. S13-E01 TaxID=3031326 RepID=UPI0023D7B9B8|nr:molybdenum cofactor guanylyltransferase [Cytobacillus sp. S13-E01]MDF0727001.1 molybdenum cofactor guanylyltransferase [Cytobacillus sp. S13-E01]
MKDCINLRVAGIILAGGESRRFGSPKAIADYKGRKFIEYALDSIQNITKEIIIVSHETLSSRIKQVTSIPVTEDLSQYKGNGPLAGIVTGMCYYQTEWYIVLPCDTPLVTEELIKRLLEHTEAEIDAVVPVVEGKIQPLIALYHTRVIDKAKRLLTQNKYKMMSLLDGINTKYITEKNLQVTATIFQNINSQDDLDKLNKLTE